MDFHDWYEKSLYLEEELRDCGMPFQWWYCDRGVWKQATKVCNRIKNHDGKHLWITNQNQ